MSAPELSVVMAAHGTGTQDALTAIRESCAGLDAEVIVVSNADVSPAVQIGGALHVCVVSTLPGTLTPVQWGEGARMARGRVVAFTTSHMRVGATWARALLAALPGDVLAATSAHSLPNSQPQSPSPLPAPPPATVWGAGGTICLAAKRHGVTDTAYFLRFSAFMPALWAHAQPARDIAGDNAAYRREAIMRYPELLAEGFWEVEFHRRFAADGGTLLVVPGAEATLASSESYSSLMRQRWTHARNFGGWRVARHGVSRLRIAILAPLVPFVLLGRIERRVLRSRRNWGRFVRVWPRLLPLTFAWAAGEAVGAASTGASRDATADVTTGATRDA